jgi:hypothetical protein
MENKIRKVKAYTSILSRTLLPIARPRPHGTAAASTSPTYGLRLFLALEKQTFFHVMYTHEKGNEKNS